MDSTRGRDIPWQLTTPIDLTTDAEVYDIDLFDNSTDVIAALHTEGRAVFQVEYTDRGVRLSDFCSQARQNQFTGILKRRDLDSWRESCSVMNP